MAYRDREAEWGIRRISRRRKFRGQGSFLQRLVLCFLVGFFLGVLFYYFFRQSFSSLTAHFMENVTQWKNDTGTSWLNYVRVLWNHGKYFLFVWIFAVNPVVENAYQLLFAAYTGIRNGFLLLFFIMSRGMRGLFLYGVSMFPQVFLFLPLYLFFFAWIQNDRHRRKQLWVPVLIVLLFFLACFLELRCNLPLMKKYL